MDNFHSGSGRIVYDPYRGEMKSRTKWWSIVEVDREITRYYRWWLERELHIRLQQPSWDAHISIIRGEATCGQRPELWKKHQHMKVNFLYEHGNFRVADDKKNGGQYYWIDVECPMLGKIRKEMGLPVGWRFHITIGRTYY